MENSALETLDCHGIEHIEIFGGLCTLLGVISEDIFWTMLEMAMKNIQLQRLCDSNFFSYFLLDIPSAFRYVAPGVSKECE